MSASQYGLPRSDLQMWQFFGGFGHFAAHSWSHVTMNVSSLPSYSSSLDPASMSLKRRLTSWRSSIEEHVHRRASNPNVSRRPQITSALLLLGINEKRGEPEAAVGKKRGRCVSCARNKDVKVSNRCSLCSSFVCGIHSTKTTIHECLQCPSLSDDDDTGPETVWRCRFSTRDVYQPILRTHAVTC